MALENKKAKDTGYPKTLPVGYIVMERKRKVSKVIIDWLIMSYYPRVRS